VATGNVEGRESRQTPMVDSVTGGTLLQSGWTETGKNAIRKSTLPAAIVGAPMHRARLCGLA